MREAQGVVELSRAEERRLTYLGQDQTYNRLIEAMGLNNEMIEDYYNKMHEEILRAYTSPYVEQEMDAWEEVEVVTPGERGDPEEAIKTPQEDST